MLSIKCRETKREQDHKEINWGWEVFLTKGRSWGKKTELKATSRWQPLVKELKFSFMLCFKRGDTILLSLSFICYEGTEVTRYLLMTGGFHKVETIGKQKGRGRIDYLTEKELRVTFYLFPSHITKCRVLENTQSLNSGANASKILCAVQDKEIKC